MSGDRWVAGPSMGSKLPKTSTRGPNMAPKDNGNCPW